MTPVPEIPIGAEPHPPWSRSLRASGSGGRHAGGIRSRRSTRPADCRPRRGRGERDRHRPGRRPSSRGAKRQTVRRSCGSRSSGTIPDTTGSCERLEGGARDRVEGSHGDRPPDTGPRPRGDGPGRRRTGRRRRRRHDARGGPGNTVDRRRGEYLEQSGSWPTSGSTSPPRSISHDAGSAIATTTPAPSTSDRRFNSRGKRSAGPELGDRWAANDSRFSAGGGRVRPTAKCVRNRQALRQKCGQQMGGSHVGPKRPERRPEPKACESAPTQRHVSPA
jgi:hypothetical protein